MSAKLNQMVNQSTKGLLAQQAHPWAMALTVGLAATSSGCRSLAQDNRWSKSLQRVRSNAERSQIAPPRLLQARRTTADTPWSSTDPEGVSTSTSWRWMSPRRSVSATPYIPTS